MPSKKTTRQVEIKAAGDVNVGGSLVGGNLIVNHNYLSAPVPPRPTGRAAPEDEVTKARPERRDLVERQDLIEAVYQFLQPKTATQRIAVLYGPPGVGKTAVAVEIVYRLLAAKRRRRPERFDAILWHEVGPVVSPEEAEYALEALLSLLRRRLHLTLSLSVDSPARQESQIIDELAGRGYKLLLVLDELNDRTAPRLMRFVRRLRGAVSILMTRSSDWQPDDKAYLHKRVPGLSAAGVQTFFKLSKLRRKFTTEELDLICQQTAGNLVALKYLANELHGQPTADLAAWLGTVTNPESSIAQRIAEQIYAGLASETAREIWKALTVFQGEAHRHTLTCLAGRDPDRPADKAQVSRALKELEEQDVLLTDQDGHRYRLYGAARSFMGHQLRLADEYDLYEQRRVAYYVGLRKRAPHQHDAIGWTILTDYQPDGQAPLVYTDELIALTHVISYCLQPERPAGYWVNAARLLDGFRAVFFMGGYWHQRLEFCQAVLQRATAEGRPHIAGQVQRLLAWMYCFGDHYALAEQLARAARQTARAGIDAGPHAADEWVVHLQTYYKALNTLGQVALRQGQQALLASQAEPASGPALAEAAARFQQARSYLTHARNFVEGLFPSEALIVDFHLAEVDFYDRRTPDPDRTSEHLRQCLDRSRQTFAAILQAAEARGHRRLAENARYYLGKSLRRLGFARAEANPQDRADFEAGRFLLETAWNAVADQDRVLRARISFALGQWHESEARLARQRTARTRAIAAARQYVADAVGELNRWGMQMESQDAAAFLIRRLG